MESSNPAPERVCSVEEQMLRDALGDGVGVLRVLSREPFGAGALSGFEEVRPAGGDEPTRYWYVDTSGKPVEAETGFLLGDPARPEARIWLHPADPRLPALAPASFPEAAATLMARLGIPIDRPPELLVYRPGQRAMFRMRAAERDTYLKIVRPTASASIVRLQEALRAGGVPVPQITGWSELGIVLTEAAAGEPLTSRLADLHAERLLDSIDALRARIGVIDVGRDARPSLASRQSWYAGRIRAALRRAAAGSDAAALAELLPAYEHELEAHGTSAVSIDAADLRTVHGDLHIGQLFVDPADPSTIAGVIDIDTAGLGDPADDEAALLGHLIASIALAQRDPERSAALGAMLAAGAARWLAPGRPCFARVRHRFAVHVLAHALAPIERGDLKTAIAQLRRGAAVLDRG